MFAGAHFAVNVLLARWLTPAAYGAFALVYSISLLLLLLYMALFFEPLLVFGSAKYAPSFPKYVRVLVRAHFLFFLPVGLGIVVASPFIRHLYGREAGAAFLALTVVSPMLLLVWLCRASFYAQLKPHAGTVAGLFYLLVLLGCIYLLRFFGGLSAWTALGSMGLGSFLVSSGCLYWLKVRSEPGERSRGLGFSVVVSDHWSYGRWAALTGLAMWVPANLYYAILPSKFGLAGTAELRALMNLVYPLLHTVTALVLLLIPVLVRQREGQGLGRLKRTVEQLIALFVPVGLVYLFLLVLFCRPLVQMLYAGQYGDVPERAVLSLGFLPVTTGVAGILGAGIRALERPRLVFWAYLLSSATAVFVGVPLALGWGVSGAALALVLDDVPVIAMLAFFLVRAKDAGRTVA
jgi:O-antigen/teichoic acid export membrane protein